MARKSKGRLYQLKKGGTWYLEYWVNKKRHREALRYEDGTPVTKRTEAERLRETIMAPLALTDEVQKLRNFQHRLDDMKGRRDDVKRAARKRVRMVDVWDRYVSHSERNEVTQRTIIDYRSLCNKLTDWCDDNGLTFLDEFTPDHSRTFAAYLESQRLSAHRFNRIIRFGKRVYELLEDSTDINPFDTIRLKHSQPVSKRDLTETELKDVLEKATGELRTLFVIGIYTALRLKDCCLLRWEDVNLKLNRLSTKPSKSKRYNKRITIPRHPGLADILRQTPTVQRQSYVLKQIAASYLKRPDTVVERVQRHFKCCGIVNMYEDVGTVKKRTLVGFHSLRHTFVTLSAEAGTPLPVLQAICGHGSPQVQKVYLHMGETAMNDAIDAIPDVVTTGDNGIDGNQTETDEDRTSTIANSLRSLLGVDDVQAIHKMVQDMLGAMARTD